VSGTGTDQFISTITDTVGRIVHFNYTNNQLQSITQTVQPSSIDPSGTHTYATFSWGQKYGGNYVWYKFSNTFAVVAPPLTSALNVLTGCAYANGTGYRFSYDDWAIVDKIERLNAANPQQTVSYFSYNFPAASGAALANAPTYTQQTVSPDGGTANLAISKYGFNITSFGLVTSETITDPNLNVTTINLNTDGTPASTTFKDAQTNTVVRTINYTWKLVGSSMLPDQVTTVLNDLSPSQQSSVQYFYDSNGNITDLYERGFTGAIFRHTNTSFKGGSWLAQHILNLPSTIYVKDGSDTIVSRTDFGYDESSFTNTIGGLPTHDDTTGTVRGNLTSMTRYASPVAGAGQVTRNYGYDSLGNLRTADMDCCNQKTFNFSAITQYAYPDSVTRGVSPQFTSNFTYNSDNGLLLTSSDENAQVTQYQYDVMYRPTNTTGPPSNGQNVRNTLAYADSVLPLTVTVSNAVNSAVGLETFDGLGRLTESDTKNASALVNSVTYSYDKLSQRIQASNPFASGETPVFTNYGYDGLGRVTSISPPSGGSTAINYAGNVTTIKDPAGKQRRNYADAAGRLVQVDEPGVASAGTAAGGTLPVNGILQQTGTPASGHVDISGFENYTTDFNNCAINPHGITTCASIYDSGTVSVTINGFTVNAFYGQNSTNVGVASAIRNGFNVANSPVTASLSGLTVSFVTKAVGASTNYSMTCSSSSNDDTDFPSPSFSASCSGAALTGGQAIFDSGTVNVTINGFTGSAPYSQPGNNTATLVATALVGTGSTGLNRAGSPVHVTASGASLIITYNNAGAGGNVAAILSSTTSQTAYFSGGSFNGSTMLGNGQDPYSSGLDHPYTTMYTYDVMDRLTAVSQAAGIENGQSRSGQARSYTYDGLGRVLASTTPEQGTVTTYYTNSSGLACAGDPSLACRIVDARGVNKNFSYDGINRLSGVTYTNDPASTAPATYQYDTGGQGAFALGRLTKITEGSNSQTFTYDNRGRITSANMVIDGTPYPLTYAYNAADQVTSITYPTSRIVSQNFDALGRMQSIASGGTTYLAINSYNSAMQPIAVTYGNQVQGAFHFNDHLQIDTLRYYKTGAASDILNLSYDYTTGVSGNNGQAQVIRYYTSPGVEDTTKSEYFSYDNWARLSAAHTGTVDSIAGTWSLSWTYDRLGNRLSQTLNGGNVSIGQPQFTVDQNTNRITNTGYTYDLAGNMTHDANIAYGYDGANRMISANNGSTLATYIYFGPFRIKKVVSSTATISIYSGNRPIAEYTNGSLSKEYIYSGLSLLATISAGVATYHHPDHLSNRAETDSSGNPARSYGHFPFGETWYETGTPDPWKFTVYGHDSESNLDYATFRFFGSGLGRFASVDPEAGILEMPQSLNRYTYSMNDPINLTDPLGRNWFTSLLNAIGGMFCCDEMSGAPAGPMGSPGIPPLEPGPDGSGGETPPPKPTDDCHKFADMVEQIANSMFNGKSNNPAGDIQKFMDKLVQTFTGRKDATSEGLRTRSGNSASSFGSTGFAASYYEADEIRADGTHVPSNQVRHSVAGLAAGYVGGFAALPFANSREHANDPIHGVPDINLNNQTIPEGAKIGAGQSGVTDKPGWGVDAAKNLANWIRNVLCNH
jgi:RHS repeat-associated protein